MTQGLSIFFFGTVTVVSPLSGVAPGEYGVWEAGKVQPNVTSVPETQSGSLGAYVSFQSSAGADVQVR